MDAAVLDWANLLLRWVHVIVGIAWIGSSFFFIWLDLSLNKREGLPDGVAGETWMVHGGGFYHAQKYLVAPEQLPEHLHWFKWESYATWISGFCLMAVIYYFGAESFLIDRQTLDVGPAAAIAISLAMLAVSWVVYDLICRSPLGNSTGPLAVAVFVLVVGAAFLFSNVFSGRAAFVHVGAMIGTIMSANVFFIIIPNQKKTVAAMLAGKAPDAVWGMQAKQRSTHNNYLTLPVLLMMISNHYPMTFGHEYNWLIVAVVLIIGGVVRDWFNTRNAGGGGSRTAWQWPLATVLTVGLAVFVSVPWNVETLDEEKMVDADGAFAIVQTHCVSCHATEPINPDFDAPPGGVVFESVDHLRTHAVRILAQTVTSQAMPLGNTSEMTELERQQIGAWIRAGQPD